MIERRLIDFGEVAISELLSATEAAREEIAAGRSPDTLLAGVTRLSELVMTRFEDPEKDVDLGACKKYGVLCNRIVTGGGATMAWAGAICFTHTLSTKSEGVPSDMLEANKYFADIFVEWGKNMGLDLHWRPINDVETVENRKFINYGATVIHHVVQSTSIVTLDSDPSVVAKVIKVPPEKFIDKKAKSIEERTTTLKRELGRIPSYEEVKEAYFKAYEKVTGTKLVPGEMTEIEKKSWDDLVVQRTSGEWLYMVSERKKFGDDLKLIGTELRKGEGVHKAKKLIRATVLMKGDKIKNLYFSGDFYLSPWSIVDEMENTLKGIEAEAEVIRRRIEDIYARPEVQLTTTGEVDDWVTVVMKAVQNAA